MKDLVDEAEKRIRARSLPRPPEPPADPTARPVLMHLRNVALMHLWKRDRAIVERIDLSGTHDPMLEMKRAQVIFKIWYPSAESLREHPLGPVAAMAVDGVLNLHCQITMPRTSAEKRKFFIDILKMVMAARL